MPPLPYRNLNSVTRYQELIAFARRFDRDLLLVGLARAGANWTGSSVDEHGRMHPFLPWNVSGAAATVIARGTRGGRNPTLEDIRRLCYLFFNLEHPGTPGDADFGLQLLGRVLYQQWPYLRLDLKEWARPVALFNDTDFSPGYTPEVMVPGWETDLLGSSMAEFVSVGFTLYAAARTGGRHPLVWDEGLAELVEIYGGRERFDEIVETQFVTDIERFKESRRGYIESNGLSFRHEPFAFNPLHSTPLVRGVIPDEALAPSTATIQIRTGATGILYAGMDKWGTAFSRDFGHKFEQYVGKNLRLLNNVQVHPEVLYRTSQGEKLSIDWFVVTPDAVLLIECKSLVPSADVREGRDLVAAHSRLDRAIRQVNATAAALTESRSEFNHIPIDRPLVGLVVTFGNFDLANDVEIRATLTRAEIPTAVVGIDFIEELATWSEATMRERLADVSNHSDEFNSLDPREWSMNAEHGENPLITDAFGRLPAVQLLTTLRPEILEAAPSDRVVGVEESVDIPVVDTSH